MAEKGNDCARSQGLGAVYSLKVNESHINIVYPISPYLINPRKKHKWHIEYK